MHIIEILASKQNWFGQGYWTEQECGFIQH